MPVSNVREAFAFYSELLGLTDEGTGDDFATLGASDSVLWLHREEHAVERAGVELWIRVDDVDATYERFLAAGLDDLRPPGDVATW